MKYVKAKRSTLALVAIGMNFVAAAVGPCAIAQSPAAETDATAGDDAVAATPSPSKAPATPMATEKTPDASAARNPFPGEGPLYDTFRDTAYELRCPTCTGLSVLDSDATFSVQIRDIVKEQVRAGKSKSDILQFFTERYGPWILREPPAKGFNAIAWGLPLALLLVGPPSVWFFVWRKRKVVSTMGVRSSDEILVEMTARLKELRAGFGAAGKAGRGGEAL